MTTTTTTTTTETLPVAADARLIPLDAILAFEAETEQLAGVLDAAADAEDLLASAACIDCHVDQVSMLLDPAADRANFLPTEALLVGAGSMPPDDCVCDQADDNAPCSAECRRAECVAAFSVYNGG